MVLTCNGNPVYITVSNHGRVLVSFNAEKGRLQFDKCHFYPKLSLIYTAWDGCGASVHFLYITKYRRAFVMFLFFKHEDTSTGLFFADLCTYMKHIFQTVIYSRLSLSRIPRDSLNYYFEISVLRHIRFAELRKNKSNNHFLQMYM